MSNDSLRIRLSVRSLCLPRRALLVAQLPSVYQQLHQHCRSRRHLDHRLGDNLNCMACEQRSYPDDYEHGISSLIQHHRVPLAPANSNVEMASRTPQIGAHSHARSNVESRKSRPNASAMKRVALALLSTSPALVSAQDSCIPLTGSSACPAFRAASISVNTTLIGYL